MKKSNLFLTCAIASCALVTSCKEDVENVAPVDESGQVKETDTGIVNTPDQFTSLSPEENKKNLEDDGLSLLKDVDDLTKAPAVEVTTSFVSFLDQSEAEPMNGRLGSSSRMLSDLATDRGSVQSVFASMRTTEEGPESIQAIYDEYVGVWSWNADQQVWDHSVEGDKIVFEFPSTETGTQNNAQYVIHSYEGIAQDSPLEDYEGDLPTKIETELTVDGQRQASYSFVAAYNQAGEPTQLTTSLSVNSFIFSIKADNNTQKVGTQYSLKRDNRTLLAMGAGAYGNFSAEHIDNLDYDKGQHEGDVVNRVDAYFQLMNVVLAGNMDIKKYLDGYEDNYQEGYYKESTHQEEDGYYTNTYEYSSGYHVDSVTEQNAQLLEEAFNLKVFYADGSGKIADTEVYTTKETDVVYRGYYDEEQKKQVSEEKEVEYQMIDVRMVFEDESKADLETYFSEGFDDLVKEFEEFAEEMGADLD